MYIFQRYSVSSTVLSNILRNRIYEISKLGNTEFRMQSCQRRRNWYISDNWHYQLAPRRIDEPLVLPPTTKLSKFEQE